MKILYVSGWFPYPPDNGSRIRTYNLLKGLATRHRVTLLTFTDRLDVSDSLPALSGICQSIETIPWKKFQPSSPRALLGILNPVPRSYIATYSPQMAEAIRRHTSDSCDIIVASELIMLPYTYCFAYKPALLEEVELASIYDEYIRAPHLIPRLRHAATWTKTKGYLAGLLPSYRACTVVSIRERDILARAAPDYKPVTIIPNCIDLDRYERVRGSPRPDSLIFSGSLTYAPNYDAVIFFLQHIFPTIRRQLPDVRLQITGRLDGVSLPPVFAGNGTEVLGYVPDVLPLIASSSISVVPLRIGGGTRYKILEAMALGTPVVSTTKGAEGLDVQHQKHLLIADDPGDFATSVMRLLRDPGLRGELAANARQLVLERYSWERVLPRFLSLVEDVARIAE